MLSIKGFDPYFVSSGDSTLVDLILSGFDPHCSILLDFEPS